MLKYFIHPNLGMKFYAVKVGRNAPIITTTWEQCSQLVNGFSGAVFKSFNKKEEAENYLNGLTAKIEVKSSIINGFTDFEFIQEKLMSLDSTVLIVHTDGSCINQGLADRSLWRAGSGIFFPQLNLKIGLKVDGEQTNNRGELLPVVWILESLITIKNPVIKKLIIHSDSNYVIENLNSKHTKNRDLWNRLNVAILLLGKVNESDGSSSTIGIEFVKDLAHSGIEGNEIADEIAKFMANSNL